MPLSVRTGIDLLSKKWPVALRDARIGLLIHPASVNRRFISTAELFLKAPERTVTAFFGPQHGLWGQTQDNMVEWQGFRDKKTGIPVYSLYGKTRKPSAEMLREVDAIVIDLQDVGARYYTFIWTMTLVMEACLKMNKAVVILDRPNPINGTSIEGPVLSPQFASFVGLHPLPVRHGMTMGEIALYLKDIRYQRLSLFIIPMQGWKRDMWFNNTGLPWVPPSPNMPSLDTAMVYPGMCLLEGTNLSEGRGTTRPFEIFGAPYIEAEALAKKLRDYRLPGVVIRALHFLPTFQKYAGKLCGGAQLHITDRNRFRPFKTASAILSSVYELYPAKFKWNSPPYEYEKKHLPIDILAGTDRLRNDIEKGERLEDMEAWWSKESSDFDRKFRRKYLIY